MQAPVRGRRALWSAAAAVGALFLVSCGGDYDSAPTPRTYATTVVVGASLSDTGNTCNFIPAGAGCPPAPPYATGRYSNGPLWVETVATNYGSAVTPSRTGGNNFAYAGARTGSVRAALDAAGLQAVTLSAGAGTAPSVPGINSALGTTPSQIDALLAKFNYQIAPQTLVIVDATTFGNNISDILTLSAQFPANAAAIGPAVVAGAVADVVGTINRLYAAGARTILVVNVPNVGATPRVTAIPGASGPATALSQAFNANVAAQVNGLRAVLTGSNIILFDLYALEAMIKAGTAPGGFTLANLTAACFAPPAATCATPATYFYWDSFHPTVALGAYVAARVIAAIPAP